VKHTLHIIVLDRPSVLARVAGQVGRRGVNIDHFTARNIADGRTVITIGIDTDEDLAERLAMGIARLIDVLDVTWKKDEMELEPELHCDERSFRRLERRSS